MEKRKTCSKRNGSLFIKQLMIVGILLLLSIPTYAQSPITVTGIVKDLNKEAVIGAAVSEKGKPTLGTMTDLDGKFSINVSSTDVTLVITYIGMKTTELDLKGRRVVEIFMESNNVMLDDVVVTALGIKRQTKALGYAMSEVKGDEITAGRDGNMMSALSGKVAGVDISGTTAGPSGSTRVIIRGNSQLSGSNLPLYVIDGVPMENTQLGSAGKWGGYDYGDGLSAVNPDDIESISVLKGPSASALYGSRASNGVVLITTKTAKKGAGLGVEVSMNVNAVKIGQSFDDYQRIYGQGRDGKLMNLLTDASGSTQSAWGAKMDPTLSVPIYNGENRPYSNVNNNVLSFFRTGVTTTNSVALSKNMDKGDFRFSVSDMRNSDIVPESDMARTTFMLRGSAKLSNKVTVEARANYTHEKVNNRPALSDSPNNIGNSLIGIAPSFDQKWLSSNYKDEFGRYNAWNGNANRLNPYWVINEMTNRSTKNRLMAHAQISYEILPILTVQAKAGTDFYKFRITDRSPMYTPGLESGTMNERSMDVYENNFEGLIRYHQTFNDWDISAFVGGNIMRAQNEAFVNTGIGQVDANASSILNYEHKTLDYSKYRKEVHSIYGAINLGYKDYAFVDVTLRNDVSSSLAKSNRSYTYPSVSGSFVFTSFFDLKSTPITFGKVRASWAKVGGDTDPYRLDLAYGLRNITFQGNPLGEISSGRIPLRDLKPTSTYSHEFGLDIRLFEDRFGLDVGYYSQNTKDQILNLPISRATGYSEATINAGEITNKGVEITLTAVPVRTKSFEWTTTFNMARNINNVKELHPDVKEYELSNARWANAFIYASEGEAYGAIVGRKMQRDPNGNVILENGLPTFESGLSVLGNGNHDLTMGIGNRFTYKGFTLNVLLDMKFGADIYSMTALQSHMNGTSKNTLEGRDAWYASEEDRMSQNIRPENWTATGGYVGKGVMNIGTADNPIYVDNDVPVNPSVYWRSFSETSPEPFIYSASYVKLRELTLTYNLPSRFLAKTFIKDVSFTAYGRNLWVIHSNLKNIDPESNYNNGNGQGFEYGSLPTRRTFGFGVNLKF